VVGLLVDAAEARDGGVQLVVMQLQRVWDLLGETWPHDRLLGIKRVCVEFPRLHHLVRLMRLRVLLLLDLLQ
jgi:hypothetical protein